MAAQNQVYTLRMQIFLSGHTLSRSSDLRSMRCLLHMYCKFTFYNVNLIQLVSNVVNAIQACASRKMSACLVYICINFRATTRYRICKGMVHPVSRFGLPTWWFGSFEVRVVVDKEAFASFL